MCNHDIDRGHCGGDSGGPLFIKILKGFLLMFGFFFVLPIVLGVLGALFSILDILF